MILHTLSATPSSAAFSDCLAVAGPGDAILLLGDGVYCAVSGGEAAKALSDSGAAIHVLQADALAAGVGKIATDMHALDMDGFVGLTERYARQMAWY